MITVGTTPPASRVVWGFRLVIAFGAMYASMVLGHLALPGGSGPSAMVSPVWPATGVSIALVLLWGWRVLPAVFAASMLANWREFGAAREALLAPVGDTIEPLVAWLLLRWTKTGMPPLRRAPDVARFIALGAIAAPVAGALVGLSLLRAAEFVIDARDARVWLTWFLPSVVGVLVVSPVPLALVRHHAFPWRKRRWWESALLGLMLGGVCVFVFGRRWQDGWLSPEPLVFLSLPPIAWAVFMYGALGGSAATLLVSIGAVLGTALSRGPFAAHEMPEGFLLTQLYIAVLAVTSLMLGAVTSEWAASYRALERKTRSGEMLLRELNHRVRNNLGSLLSLIDLSRSSAASVDGYAETVRGRVLALSHVHGLLAQGSWEAVDFAALAASIIDESAPRRVSLIGPAVQVPATRVSSLGMVLHELLTNSERHGALSNAAGRVRLEWSVARRTDGAADLLLVWTEEGGPVPNPSPPRNMGLNLIEGLTRSDLRGSAEFAFPSRGACHRLKVDLSDADAGADDDE